MHAAALAAGHETTEKDTMMAYLEMFVGSVASDKKDDYRNYAGKMEAITLRAGALSVSACWGLSTPQGMLKVLADGVQVGADETLVTRIVRWQSKTARDEGWAKMMSTPDPEMANIQMPFDRTRVYYADFEELGEA